MEEIKYKVYVKVDTSNTITQVESDLSDIDFSIGWIQIDEGTGDKYSHAQSNYFPEEKPLRDNQFRSNYKLVDNKPVELTEEEKEKLFPEQAQQPSSQDTLNAQLLKANAEITTQLDNQKTLNSQLLLDIAKLKGGN